jgi:hypothetical protein
LRALRANRVLRADEKRIRSENAVMIKSNSSLEWFFIQGLITPASLL